MSKSKMFNEACVCWGLSHVRSLRHSWPSSSPGQSCSPQSLWQLQMPAQISEYKIEQRSTRWGSMEGVKHLVKCADRHSSVLWSCRQTAGRDRSSSLSTQAELLSAFSGSASLFISYILLFYLFLMVPAAPQHFTWSFLWVWFSRVKFPILMMHQTAES